LVALATMQRAVGHLLVLTPSDAGLRALAAELNVARLQ
jgi:hypothetical protein